ncbi:helicase C-terminal domain-containing protein, partial [Alistipes senegalensis]|uniref:helicase C-terminal domain-containing protein n=1 Tax=Alistipes senegalensis TaxID=1288121 RepID=UPI001E330DB4
TIPGKVAIGCTSHAAFDLYERFIRENYPERPLFTARGDITLARRLKIVDAFDASLDGILVCTQQSLSSSVNIPTCDDIILEALQWNLSRMEQFYFRFIRLDSERMKRVHFFTYEDSVEQNLMALVLTKERLNEFIDSGEVKEESEIFSEFGVTMSVIESLLKREADKDGKVHVSWGSQRIAG